MCAAKVRTFVRAVYANFANAPFPVQMANVASFGWHYAEIVATVFAWLMFHACHAA